MSDEVITKSEGSVEARPSEHENLRRDFFSTSTFASWIGVSVFLVSFGVVINNTSKNGEPYVGTAMLGVGVLLLSLASIVFFRSNWPLHHKPYLIWLFFFVLLLICVIIVAAVRIWVPFTKPHSSSSSSSSSS